MEQPPETLAADLPLIVVVGADALAVRVCAELCAARRHEVVLLWDGSERLAERVRRLGARHVGRKPEEIEALREAGIERAAVVMALATDDHRNVQVVLRSRDLNPSIRVVLRQFNRELGRKIESNLSNCSVLSLSTHAAATYAAAAADATCFHGLQFPDIDGELAGFAHSRARDWHVGGLSVREAERRLDARVIAADGELIGETAVLDADADLVIFRRIRPEGKGLASSLPRLRPRAAARRIGRMFAHLDPVVRGVAAAALLTFSLGTFYFAWHLGLDPFTAAYFVLTTMTTTGYGDITPPRHDDAAKLAAMLLMIGGVTFTGTFIAIVTSKLTDARWASLYGLRRIRRRGHFVVCGAGRVGSRVIDFLLRLGQHVVVIETNPSPEMVERSRDRNVDLLTGDATRDETLALCNLHDARGLVALTESDTINLETALAARARNPSLPLVMRVSEGGLAVSIKRHFGLDRTFGSAALAAPAFAGLAFHDGARGRIAIDQTEFAIIELRIGDPGNEDRLRRCVPLCVWRGREIVSLRDCDKVQAGERILALIPVGTPERFSVEDMAMDASGVR